jgi:hypothetical protein
MDIHFKYLVHYINESYLLIYGHVNNFVISTPIYYIIRLSIFFYVKMIPVKVQDETFELDERDIDGGKTIENTLEYLRNTNEPIPIND